MTKQNLKEILEHLPVFRDEPDCKDFRKNPIKAVEIALITESTNQGKGYHPFKIRTSATVFGRDKEYKILYFTDKILLAEEYDWNFAVDSNFDHRSISIGQIESYEILKKLE